MQPVVLVLAVFAVVLVVGPELVRPIVVEQIGEAAAGSGRR